MRATFHNYGRLLHHTQYAACTYKMMYCILHTVATISIWDSFDQRRSLGGLKGLKPPLAIRILMFIFLVFHQHCTVSRDRVHCKMFFDSTTGVATHSLSNQAVMNFRDLRKIEAAFFIPACFALPYITRAGCCHALPVSKQA